MGLHRVTFAVDDIDDTIERSACAHAAASCGAMLGSTRTRTGSAISAAPAGIIVGLAEQIG